MQQLAYRINDFSKISGLGRTTIYGLIKEGKLRPVKIAGRTLIPASEAQRLFGEVA